jgi:hypothetical protein
MLLIGLRFVFAPVVLRPARRTALSHGQPMIFVSSGKATGGHKGLIQGRGRALVN